MEDNITQPPHWTLAQRQLLRFFGLYFLLYFYTDKFDFVWDPIVKQAGRWLHIWEDIAVYPNGSGDTTYNYIQVLCLLIIALASSSIWWMLDHKRKSYNTLLYWIMALLRYALAYYLIAYGFAKLYQSQFPYPSLRTLMKPYGDASPMNLAWTFIGYSYPYNVFIGMAEVIGGSLLLFRRTTMFGCLFCMTVISNIVALNFCYDIPVKLYSTHLLLTAIFIVTPYIPRLTGFFLLHKEIPALPKLSLYNTRGKRIIHLIIKTVIIVLIARSQMAGDDISDFHTKPPLFGLYETDHFIHNSDTLQPLITNTGMWRYLTIDVGNRGGIITMDGKSKGYWSEVDTIERTIHFSTDDDTVGMLLHYKKDIRHLYISYAKPGDTIAVQLHSRSIKDFRLVNTGFHWISEEPNNK